MLRPENIKRIVIKIGTSTLTHATGKLDLRRLETLARVLTDIKNTGLDVVLVTSGAIGVGMSKLGMTVRPKELRYKQAAAAVGQCELMYTYDKLFSEYHHTVAQILLTAADIESETRHENFHNTLGRLLELGAIPVINENDTIATEEIVIGDNDTLAAMTAVSISADLLVLLSDIDGLYTADPHTDSCARLIDEVREITPEILALAGGKGSELSTGGMTTKLRAADNCMKNGVDMIIANGGKPELLYDIAEGSKVGTRFIAK